MYTRRAWFQAALAGSAIVLLTRPLVGSTSKKPQITVFKRHDTPCCDSWITHVRRSGFTVVERPVKDLLAVKSDYKIPGELITCHTAVVSGYIVEGHVPADLIHKLLQERPLVAGIAVPGLPSGAPGNERAGKEAFSVVLFDYDGKIKPYAQR